MNLTNEELSLLSKIAYGFDNHAHIDDLLADMKNFDNVQKTLNISQKLLDNGLVKVVKRDSKGKPVLSITNFGLDAIHAEERAQYAAEAAKRQANVLSLVAKLLEARNMVKQEGLSISNAWLDNSTWLRLQNEHDVLQNCLAKLKF